MRLIKKKAAETNDIIRKSIILITKKTAHDKIVMIKPYINILGKITRNNLPASSSFKIENTDGVTTDIKKIMNPIIKECRKIPNSNIINLFSIIF